MLSERGEAVGTVEALVALAKRGNEGASRRIYEVHARRIFQLAYRMTGDQAFAEDLTQDTFIRAFDRLHTFKGDAAFGTWLHGIAVRVILNGLRSRKRRTVYEAQADDPVAASSSSDADESRTALQERLRGAINLLPDDLRMVVLLYDVEGHSHQEVATMLNIGAGAARMRLNRARARLREMLEDVYQEWKDA